MKHLGDVRHGLNGLLLALQSVLQVHVGELGIPPAGMIRTGSMRPMMQETSSFVARSLRRIRRALEDSVNG